MSRKKKNPNYNPEKIMNDLLETVSELYSTNLSLRKIGDELDLDQQKVRKLLCTANYRGIVKYESEIADEALEYFKEKKTVIEIMGIMKLSRASVQSYLPYIKIPYKGDEVSANAERLRIYRERVWAVEKLQEDPQILWNTIKLFQHYPFRTDGGEKFKYIVQDNELILNKGEKTITKSVVERAYKGIIKNNIEESWRLDAAGTYLDPIFVRLGAIRDDEQKEVNNS